MIVTPDTVLRWQRRRFREHWTRLSSMPLVEPLQQLRFAYGPARIAVGVLMLESIRRIAFDDLTELVPAFVTITMMVFTYNIANGPTTGLCSTRS